MAESLVSPGDGGCASSEVDSWTAFDRVRSDTRMGGGGAGGGFSGTVENRTVLDLVRPDTLTDVGGGADDGS